MIAESKIYNSDLLKGTGLIQETLLLVDLYDPGISREQLLNKVLGLNALGKEHKNRTKDIINIVFKKRYLNNGEATILEIKELRNRYLSLEIISQIFFIYTCKANLLLFDFVIDVYQPCVKSNALSLPERAASIFIENAIRDSRISKKWSEETKVRVARHLNACLADFKLIDRNKNIIPFHINDFTVNYWAHKLHFKNFSDEAILTTEEWKLFGLTQQELITIFQRLSYSGNFIFQHSGELTRIGWKYQSMNDFINGAA